MKCSHCGFEHPEYTRCWDSMRHELASKDERISLLEREVNLRPNPNRAAETTNHISEGLLELVTRERAIEAAAYWSAEAERRKRQVADMRTSIIAAMYLLPIGANGMQLLEEAVAKTKDIFSKPNAGSTGSEARNDD